MTRKLLALPRLSGGRHTVPRIASLLLLGVLGVLGARAIFQGAPNTKSVPMPPPGTDSLGLSDPGAFHGMRPRADDKMTPPRIGFRWTWTPDSARAAVPLKQVKFRVHLISSDSTHEVTRSVTESQTHVNLRDTFPVGTCQWWVEALVPGHPPVRSGKETFVLEQ
jgi:hypothetical protein